MDFSFFDNILKEFNRPLNDPVLVFSLILAIILFSPLLLKRFKIPSIIGLIISGIIFGPNGINLLEMNSAIDLFSTIGLLYIMFIAGLELDMNNFKNSKYKSLVFGFLSFVIPFVSGFFLSFYVLGYDFNASMLISLLFSTHTLVAYPIISKYGLVKNEAVSVAVGGTILTDTTVLVLLAVNLSSSKGSLNTDFWLILGGSFLVFLFIMFFLIPRIAKWFLTKLESEKTSHYIFILSVLFMAAFLAKLSGLEPIIGAFAAGLALNRLIPHSSILMNRIEFIGNSIFIPFFLISVGMIVNLNVFFNDMFSVTVALLLTAAAITSKWVASLFTQHLFKYSPLQRQLIFSLSTSHAAAILAVALVGFNNKIIDERILNSTIVIILISCIVASFVAEKTSRKMVVLSEKEDDVAAIAGKKDAGHFLIPLANISNLQFLLDFAVLLKSKNSRPITILSVVPNDQEAEANLIAVKKNLEPLAGIASASGVNLNVIATIDYNISSGIIRTSKEVSADFILLGWPGKVKIIDKFIGVRTENVINNSAKNIFLCHFNKSLLNARKVILLVPTYCELEFGFEHCLSKIPVLAKELSIEITCFADEKTHTAVKKVFAGYSFKQFTCKTFSDWDDFLILSREIGREDIIVFFSGRKGSVSFQGYQANIIEKLEKFFSENLTIVAYPQSNPSDNKFTEYKDVDAEPLSQSIKTIQKIGRELGEMIKKI